MGYGKRLTRECCDYKWDSLLKTVPEAFDSISLITIRKFARKSHRYLDSYRQGKNGKEAEEDQQKHHKFIREALEMYKSHRRINESYLEEVVDDLFLNCC